MHLPAIDAIQLLIRNINLIERKGNSRPQPANDQVIHDTPTSWIRQIIGSPLTDLVPSPVSALQIMVAPPLSIRIVEITVQRFSVADPCIHSSSDHPHPKSRKRHYERGMYADYLDEVTHIIGTYLWPKPHSEFSYLTEIMAQVNATQRESIMLNSTA